MLPRQLFSLLTFLLVFGCSNGQTGYSLEIQVAVPAGLQEQFQPAGRLLLFITQNANAEPRSQIWPNVGNHIFARNLNNWSVEDPQSLTAESGLMKTNGFGLDAVPEGVYYVQAVWDQDTLESRPNAPGNLYSSVEKISLSSDRKINLAIDQVIGPRQLVDHELVRMVEIQSDTLTKWWGRPMMLRASILLPDGYSENSEVSYPLRFNVSGYGGRYTRLNNLVQNNSEFMNWWQSGEAPPIINVFLDGEGPFGDSYQLNSDNSGPYGYALINELIPHIESEFRTNQSPDYRFVDGCSTGGWVSLALQIFYPDQFNGAWSYSADAVDFEYFQLINLYDDDNAFFNEWGNPRPVARDITGDPVILLEDFIQFENVLGRSNTYVTSGGQFSAFTALYSPQGKNGLPKPLFDPRTGEIDTTVLQHWSRYDLKKHLENNWETLGPELEGKIWVWMGDMDNFYLNPAMRSLDAFLKETANPVSDAQINFTPMQGHCWEFNHRKVIEQVWKKVRKMQEE